jgi:nucleotide-binding universal stress UspA family protein
MIDMATQPKRVLVCYDGSEAAEKALDAAARLIGYGSTLAVASVAPLGADTAQARLDEARERLLERHVPATYLPLHGDAADELVDAAQVLGADMLVVGARTQNGHVELGLGPVSGDVVQRAPCDVLVVK